MGREIGFPDPPPGALSTLCLFEDLFIVKPVPTRPDTVAITVSTTLPLPQADALSLPRVPAQLVLVRYLQSGDHRHSQDRTESPPKFLHALVVRAPFTPAPGNH